MATLQFKKPKKEAKERITDITEAVTELDQEWDNCWDYNKNVAISRYTYRRLLCKTKLIAIGQTISHCQGPGIVLPV